MEIFIAYLHYISIMTLMGSLVAEHLFLKPGLDKQQISKLALIDLGYAIAAVAALTTGLLRWFIYGKGSAYYLSNPMFHTKLTLFIVLGVLSIIPTIRILKWKKQVKNGEIPDTGEKAVKKLLLYIRFELLIVIIIPLLAVLIARGIRF